jgi:hypothetical protein
VSPSSTGAWPLCLMRKSTPDNADAAECAGRIDRLQHRRSENTRIEQNKMWANH